MSDEPRVRYRAPGTVAAAAILGYLDAGLLFAVGVWAVVHDSVLVRDYDDHSWVGVLPDAVPILLSFALFWAVDRFRGGRGRQWLIVFTVLGVFYQLLASLHSPGLACIALLIPPTTIILLVAPATAEWNRRPHSPLWRVTDGNRR